ncbi:FMN-binding negative transcriptional regulator [Streptomyces populi]
MSIQPWDAALDDAEWQAWIADGHDFGVLGVNGPPGHAPVVVPTHFTVDGTGLLVHLARPHPVRKAIEADPGVTFTVTGDHAFVPGPWRAEPGVPPIEGVPTSYYAAVRFTCRATVIDDPGAKAELLRRQTAHFQPEGDHAPVETGRPPYGRMPTGIRGLRPDVTEVRAKSKYDDHKPVEQRADTARRLTERAPA